MNLNRIGCPWCGNNSLSKDRFEHMVGSGLVIDCYAVTCSTVMCGFYVVSDLEDNLDNRMKVLTGKLVEVYYKPNEAYLIDL